MKLVLANNQSAKFQNFYNDLKARSPEPFDYAGYSTLLFEFDASKDKPIVAMCLASGRALSEYDGVYINGYLNTYELAATVAIACQSLDIGFVNQEFSQPPSLSKLTMYGKLAAARVPIPKSIGGTKQALSMAREKLENFTFPAVFKRADADKGVDNYKVTTVAEAMELMQAHSARSLWILQEFIENEGFYLVSFYDDQPAFCVFRTLEKHPDRDKHKEHMYKPRGGANASLVDLNNVPPIVLETCRSAIQAMNRQIASVDCIYNKATQSVHILEVNYNPQLVTIETFRNVRVDTFLKNLKNIGK